MKDILLTLSALLGLAAAAEAVVVRKNVDVNGKKCDVVSWTDRQGKERSIALVRADGDHKGFSGGYIEEYTYFAGDKKIVAKAWNQAQEGVSGLGCAVNHHKGASSSKADSTNAKTELLFEGKSHILWRFHSDFSGMGKTIGLVIDWTVADGHNDILWSVSYDCSKLKDGEIGWDARGPYFQFDWDGDGKFYDAPISGIRWGDKHKFKTTPYDRGKSGWDYSEPNRVPYMMLWKEGAQGDVECGVVQTQTWAEQDAGGYWWSPKVWGKNGTGMPENWNCPFQLNAYEGYGGEKMAWGTCFGFVGSSAYGRLDGQKRRGWPFQGYTVAIVTGRHSDGLVDQAIATLETATACELTASVGKVITKGPRYAGLTEESDYAPAGWDALHAAWTLSAAPGGKVSCTLSVPSGKLSGVTFLVHDALEPKSIRLDSKALTAGKDVYVSVEAAAKSVWVTIPGELPAGKHALEIAP